MSTARERLVEDEKTSFPRQQARTRRFSLGVPRNFMVSPDGERVVFLRSPAGDHPGTSLWVYYVATGTEREVAGARQALGEGEEQLPDEERARRERSRELAGGITAYACDEAVRHAAFALNGRLWWVGLDHDAGAEAVELPAPGGVVDPHPDPTGEAVAFLSGPALYVVRTAGDGPPLVIADEQGANGLADVTWGAAEFIAAEEMDRLRGFWWAPDGRSLLAARVDNRPVPIWWTNDPSEPGTTPRAHRYPAAGEADAVVSLWHIELSARDAAAPEGGRRQQVSWDCERYPYMVAVHWSRSGPPLLLVEQRDHKACAVLS
ncbi:MAG TPA: DPP IV N-terminal domain-containing protein, partial [Acidimicrobiales bacterium]|nr:DPP IV N-terminal domain-containing protein [Acidimicrobiales bacterium]